MARGPGRAPRAHRRLARGARPLLGRAPRAPREKLGAGRQPGAGRGTCRRGRGSVPGVGVAQPGDQRARRGGPGPGGRAAGAAPHPRRRPGRLGAAPASTCSADPSRLTPAAGSSQSVLWSVRLSAHRAPPLSDVTIRGPAHTRRRDSFRGVLVRAIKVGRDPGEVRGRPG